MPSDMALRDLTTPDMWPYYGTIYDERGYFGGWFESTEGYWLSMKIIPGENNIEYWPSYFNECWYHQYPGCEGPEYPPFYI